MNVYTFEYAERFLFLPRDLEDYFLVCLLLYQCLPDRQYGELVSIIACGVNFYPSWSFKNIFEKTYCVHEYLVYISIQPML